MPPFGALARSRRSGTTLRIRTTGSQSSIPRFSTSCSCELSNLITEQYSHAQYGAPECIEAMLPFMFLLTIGACSSMFTSTKNL